MATRQCPKCAWVRTPNDSAPDWQCPACGIAYDKYSGYLEKAKFIAEHRAATTASEPLSLDGSVWSLIVTNLFVLILALFLQWRLIDMMLVYTLQSLVIGASYVARILSLEAFSTKDFKINGQSVEPTPATKLKVAGFFALHFSFFHLFYIGFMLAGDYGEPRLGVDLLICCAAFAANHAYSYFYHRARDRTGTPNIGKLMFAPYIRIVPMHLTIIIGSLLSGAFGVFVFGVLKTVADAFLHQVEHKLIAEHKP